VLQCFVIDGVKQWLLNGLWFIKANDCDIFLIRWVTVFLQLVLDSFECRTVVGVLKAFVYKPA
jgi:hypothetical protein